MPEDQFPAKCDWDVAPVPAQSEEEIDKYYYNASVEASFEIATQAKQKDRRILDNVNLKALCAQIY